MSASQERNILSVWLREMRAPFFVASAVPVVVGSLAGFASSGRFDAVYFAMALVGTVLLHAGANVANDYFDHRSGNDAANHNVSPFSGGSRVIQDGLLTPRAVLAGACALWAAGAAVGAALAAMTRSALVASLVAAGLAGGFFYSAPPMRLGYRGLGEVTVALLFGVLSVAGAFTLQAGRFEWWALAPGALSGVLVGCVLLINEFPDEEADRAASKRTLVVILGRERAARLFMIVLPSAWIAAALAAWGLPQMRAAGLLFLAAAPLMILTLKFASVELAKPSRHFAANALMILLVVVAGLSLAVGFAISGLSL